MPAILRAADHDAWLAGDVQQARRCFGPTPEELMSAHRVSRRVNSPQLPNDESLIAAVRVDPAARADGTFERGLMPQRTLADRAQVSW